MLQKLMTRLGAKIRSDAARHRAMWKNFLQAMALLIVALVSALYSSGAARDGRVIATAVSALLSLAIAVVVAWRFVPSLARSVDWDWIPFLSGYRITRDGWIYFAALAVVVSAAVNTNNNLLYMVLSALISVLILSVFLSALNLRQIVFSVQIPSRCFAGEPFPLTIIVRNLKRLFPTLSLFTETFDVGTGLVMTPGQAPLYFALAKPKGRTTEVRTVVSSKRGRIAVGSVKGASRYPFGFLMRERAFPTEAEGIAFPALLPWEEARVGTPDAQGATQRFTRGFGFELYTIRDYLPSDSARSVHWKASAKTGTPKTREYALDEERRVAIALDRFGDPKDPAAREAFERLVSQAASLVFYLMRDGVEVSFQSDEWRAPAGVSDGLMESILTYLALVEMSPDATLPDAPPDSGVVMLSLRSLTTA